MIPFTEDAIRSFTGNQSFERGREWTDSQKLI